MALFSRLSNYRNFGLLVMRTGVGVMMVINGLPKITGGFAKWEQLGQAMSHLHIHFFHTFWGFLCALTETVGGLFLILGLWYRLVSILLCINFIVASISVYAASGSMEQSSHAIELAFVFFGLIFLGAGVYSIDKS